MALHSLFNAFVVRYLNCLLHICFNVLTEKCKISAHIQRFVRIFYSYWHAEESRWTKRNCWNENFLIFQDTISTSFRSNNFNGMNVDTHYFSSRSWNTYFYVLLWYVIHADKTGKYENTLIILLIYKIKQIQDNTSQNLIWTMLKIKTFPLDTRAVFTIKYFPEESTEIVAVKFSNICSKTLKTSWTIIN